MDNAPEPDPLGFVQDRITILRGAHSALKEFGLDFDVADLLETASWLAGDSLPIVIEARRPDDDGGNETEDAEETEDTDG